MPEDVSNGIFGQQDDSTRHAYQSGFVSSAKSPRDKFLHDNPEYGYGKGAMSADYDSRKSRLVDSIRERDFPHLRQREVSTTSNEACGLDQQGIVYLDHAGATLYSVTQLRGVMNELLGSLNGNPHSQVGVPCECTKNTDREYSLSPRPDLMTCGTLSETETSQFGGIIIVGCSMFLYKGYTLDVRWCDRQLRFHSRNCAASPKLSSCVNLLDLLHCNGEPLQNPKM